MISSKWGVNTEVPKTQRGVAKLLVGPLHLLLGGINIPCVHHDIQHRIVAAHNARPLPPPGLLRAGQRLREIGGRDVSDGIASWPGTILARAGERIQRLSSLSGCVWGA